MLNRHPELRKEVRHLADCAQDTAREVRRAAREARAAAQPVSEQARDLLAQLERTIAVMASEGSAEAAQSRARLQARASALAGQLGGQVREGARLAGARVNDSIAGVEQRVATAPWTALGVAALAGACAMLLLWSGRRD